MFDDFFDGIGDLGCLAAALLIIGAPVYLAVKLVLKGVGWLADSLGRLMGKAFGDG